MHDDVWRQPHHDGSATYVPDATPALGGTVRVLLRVPRASDVTAAWVRVLKDGEPALVRAEPDHEDAGDVWLRADLPVVNPVVSYRWLLDGGPFGYQWLNQAGLHPHDVSDAADFRVTTFAPMPAWTTGTSRQLPSPGIAPITAISISLCHNLSPLIRRFMSSPPMTTLCGPTDIAAGNQSYQSPIGVTRRQWQRYAGIARQAGAR